VAQVRPFVPSGSEKTPLGSILPVALDVETLPVAVVKACKLGIKLLVVVVVVFG
jgi:hypothetical protein